MRQGLVEGAVRDEGGVTKPHYGEGVVWKEMNPRCERTTGSLVVQRVWVEWYNVKLVQVARWL